MDISSMPVHIVQAPAIAHSEISHVPAATGDVLVWKPLLNFSIRWTSLTLVSFLSPIVCQACESLNWTFCGAYAGQTVVMAFMCCTLTDNRHVYSQCCKSYCMRGWMQLCLIQWQISPPTSFTTMMVTDGYFHPCP